MNTKYTLVLLLFLVSSTLLSAQKSKNYDLKSPDGTSICTLKRLVNSNGR